MIRLPFRSAGAAALLALAPLATPALADPAAAPDAAAARARPGGLETRLSWGVAASNATRAHRSGATGKGVLVAMIDTGIDPAAAGLFEDISPGSVDLVPVRRNQAGNRRHGEYVASLLAGRADGAGTFGIAYEASLLSIRADRDGSCVTVCAFDAPVLARAIDHAVDSGARVIGLPVASQRPIPAIEPALARAVARGAVIVAAAGNDGADHPVWPARYAADPRFAGSMIVAGATTLRGTLAEWSNRAGVTERRYLAAPGQNVVVGCGQRTCNLTSGTSYSVAYAAGALALLLGRDPALTAPEAAAALLDNASGLARRDPDPNTGRGRLDVARALRSIDRRG